MSGGSSASQQGCERRQGRSLACGTSPSIQNLPPLVRSFVNVVFDLAAGIMAHSLAIITDAAHLVRAGQPPWLGGSACCGHHFACVPMAAVTATIPSIWSSSPHPPLVLSPGRHSCLMCRALRWPRWLPTGPSAGASRTSRMATIAWRWASPAPNLGALLAACDEQTLGAGMPRARARSSPDFLGPPASVQHPAYPGCPLPLQVLGALASVMTVWLVTGILLFEAVQRIITPDHVVGRRELDPGGQGHLAGPALCLAC